MIRLLLRLFNAIHALLTPVPDGTDNPHAPFDGYFYGH